MIKIQSTFQFFLIFFWTLFLIFIIFRVFHYFYPHNYCERFSGTTVLNSFEEIETIKKCSEKYVCMLGESKYTNIDNSRDQKIMKQRDFTCIRRYQPGVIEFK